MTDNEIIKALRLCADKGCYHCTEYGKEYCRETIASLSWDLINRQNAEIERLLRIIADKEYSCMGLASQLKVTNELLKTAKSEAVKEFLEKLEEKKKQGTMDERIYSAEMIYEVARKMTENSNG